MKNRLTSNLLFGLVAASFFAASAFAQEAAPAAEAPAAAPVAEAPAAAPAETQAAPAQEAPVAAPAQENAPRQRERRSGRNAADWNAARSGQLDGYNPYTGTMPAAAGSYTRFGGYGT